MDAPFQQLGVDSLDVLNPAFALEQEFGVRLSDDAAKQIRSVREMADNIAQLVAASPKK